MPAIATGKDLRRSSRITISIPVDVLGRDSDGMEVRAAATTKYVNKHGALLLADRSFPIETELMLQLPHQDRAQQATVVWVSQEVDENGRSGLGVELAEAENFWGVQFPPDDWVPTEAVPLAGEAPTSVVVPIESEDRERHTLRTMLNALVSVLEEKGVLTRAELSDMFQRLSRSEAATRNDATARGKSRDTSS
ncbi:MAG: PilZ domain-containing protein [Terriglobia bacterium]